MKERNRESKGVKEAIKRIKKQRSDVERERQRKNKAAAQKQNSIAYNFGSILHKLGLSSDWRFDYHVITYWKQNRK